MYQKYRKFALKNAFINFSNCVGQFLYLGNVSIIPIISLLITDNILLGSLAVDLVTISHRRSSSGACCGGNDILACYSATVQVENLGQDVVHLPGSIKLNLKGKTPGNSNGYHYESSEGDAVLTLNPKTKGI